jgi:hypothetical protein
MTDSSSGCLLTAQRGLILVHPALLRPWQAGAHDHVPVGLSPVARGRLSGDHISFLAHLRTFCLISVCLLARVVRLLSAQLSHPPTAPFYFIFLPLRKQAFYRLPHPQAMCRRSRAFYFACGDILARCLILQFVDTQSKDSITLQYPYPNPLVAPQSGDLRIDMHERPRPPSAVPKHLAPPHTWMWVYCRRHGPVEISMANSGHHMNMVNVAGKDMVR